MGDIEKICICTQQHIVDVKSPCILWNPNAEDCDHCKYLVVKEHLDSSPTIVTYYYDDRGNPRTKTFEPDIVRIKRQVYIDNPDFLEID